MSATLTDDGEAPRRQDVVFRVGSSIATGVTDERSGVATAACAEDDTRDNSIVATFDGEPTKAGSSDEAPITVTKLGNRA